LKPLDLIDKIVKEGDLKDNSIGTFTDWIIKNEGKATLSKYIEAINEDDILTLTPEGKQQNKIIFKRLHHSPFFNGLAIKYSMQEWFKEAEKIFKKGLTQKFN